MNLTNAITQNLNLGTNNSPADSPIADMLQDLVYSKLAEQGQLPQTAKPESENSGTNLTQQIQNRAVYFTV